jgi:hypothetical protein
VAGGSAGPTGPGSSSLGLFCSVLFESEEQKTPAVLDSKWNIPLELYPYTSPLHVSACVVFISISLFRCGSGVDGTEQDEGLVVVVKERKETGKKGVLREDELGRVVVPLIDLELMQARDNWSTSFDN